MGNLWIFLIILPFIAIVAYYWVQGIDYMHKNHPNYKGEDLFDEDLKKKNKK
jgi:uncharacterized membrane protein YedE/YeeE